MNSFKLFLSLLFGLFFLNLNAQVENNIVFPVTGSYSFVPEVGQQKDFNKVVIESNTFQLKMNDEIVRSYRAIAVIKGGFSVEQFFEENQSPTQDIETFNVNITDISESECNFTVSYPIGSEKIHLVRID